MHVYTIKFKRYDVFIKLYAKEVFFRLGYKWQRTDSQY